MRIGIDARMINATGIGVYIKNLILNLQQIDHKNEYVIFLPKNGFDNLNLQANFKAVMANYRWYSFAEQIFMPFKLYGEKLDVAHFPHFNVPIFYLGNFVVTIHDLTHLRHKFQKVSLHNRFYFEFKFFLYKLVQLDAVLRSRKILTVSNYVKNEIFDSFKVSRSKIIVTYEAADGRLTDLSNKNLFLLQKNFLAKFQLTPGYIFYVGNAHPHKNVEGLIEAFLMLRNKFPSLKLVLSGKEDQFWRRIKQKVEKRKLTGIIFTGFVKVEELSVLYKNAGVFVFPSFSEGFGIPPLEAMVNGCPVALSKESALPEIAGKAGWYFDPYNIQDMAEKISQVLVDKNFRKNLIKAGRKRAAQYSWKKLADETLEVYKQCV